jgi:hypothetical protein
MIVVGCIGFLTLAESRSRRLPKLDLADAREEGATRHVSVADGRSRLTCAVGSLQGVADLTVRVPFRDDGLYLASPANSTPRLNDALTQTISR